MMTALVSEALFGVALTCGIYALAQWLFARGRHVLLNPVALSIGGLILILTLFDISYDSYRVGGDLILFFLGPAVVALAVPLYERRQEILRQKWAILGGIFAGAMASIVSATALVAVLGGGRELMLTLAPKSVTAPIAIGIAETIGGIPSLSAAIVVLTGCLGAVCGPEFCRRVGIKDPVSMGIAMGTASHGIGTARMLEEHPLGGAISGLAIGLNGVMTALIISGLYAVFGG